MFRFLAIIWNPSHASEAASANRLLQRIRTLHDGWRPASDSDGIAAFYTDSRQSKRGIKLARQTGVVLGDIFTSDALDHVERVDSQLDETHTQRVVDSKGRYLVENYWGSYVAFVRGNGTEEVNVVCAPAGDLPCLFMKVDGVTVFFSRTVDLLALSPTTFSPNWEFVVRYILGRGDRFLEGTGLCEVSRVLPGECVGVRSEKIERRLYWDPVRVAASEAVEDYEQAVNAVKETTQACIGAWASCHDRLILQLSGGLDSSVVLHCLTNMRNPPVIECLNFVTPSEEGDELEFARLVAAAKNAPLHEEHWNLGDVRLPKSAGIEPAAMPRSILGRLFFAGVESNFAKSHGASAYFTGNLGDELFLEGSMAHTAADHVWHHGITPQLLGIAYHEARIGKQTVWQILPNAIGGRRKSTALPFVSEMLQHAGFLANDVLEAVTPGSLLPAVVRNIESIPPGKRTQLLRCLPPLSFYDPLEDMEQPQYVDPLKSQPLLELCLRIPTYLMTRGGVGRRLLRDAFKCDLPQQIVRRRTKGTCSDAYLQALRNNYDLLRDMLMDGMLVEQGIVDRAQLEACFKSPEAFTKTAKGFVPILYSTEAWLQSVASIPAAKNAVA